jgi:hypothetical protein
MRVSTILRQCTLWAVLLASSKSLPAQEPQQANQSSDETVQALSQKLAAQEARIEQLEQQLAAQQPQPMEAATPPQNTTAAAADAEAADLSTPPSADQEAGRSIPQPASQAPQASSKSDMSPMDNNAMDHVMQVADGPVLHFRGFLDFSFDQGPVAQNLQYPLGVPAHSSFRTGEFDLFLNSRLAEKLSFLSEIVFSTDPTNAFGVDLERYVLTYRPSKYFEIGAGRYHTSIGYYNTAYHHGTWFSTATGRPFMYYFEDSGGVLPVHEVGVTTTGYVPGSGRLDLHWVAEVGNGQAPPGPNFGDGVESFASNRDHKDANFAIYARPEGAPGLQFGGSYLTGTLEWPGVATANQTIVSAYVVYLHSKWESLNEAVLMRHQVTDGGRSYNSPLTYTQLAYKIAKFSPYFRFQYVNIPNNDPVSNFVGRYEGPSVGLRWDCFDFAALKFQYNRVFLRDTPTENGFEAAVAFTF